MLNANFGMKDFGQAKVIIGINVTTSEEGLSLDQSHYIEKIIEKYNYLYCQTACTPYNPSESCSRTLVTVLDKVSMRASLVVFVMLLIALGRK